MTKPKLVKQIPRAPTLDYFVHGAANTVTVVEIQRYPQFSVRVLGNVFKAGDSEAKIYLAQELKATFKRSRSLVVDLAKMASQYRNCGTIKDVTSLWRVCNGVKCNMVHKRFRVKSTLRHILDTMSDYSSS
jgi:hypothetical protein